MAKRVPSTEIEGIVGATRHPTRHIGRAVSAEQTLYILHSRACLTSGIDVLDCPYSTALDRGIHERDWSEREDRPVILRIERGVLIPDIAPPVQLRDERQPEPADPEPPACPDCDDSGIRRRGPEVLPCHCTEVEE